MFDLNTILTAALTAAVTEATKPLIERIEKLETNCNAYEILFKSHIERFEALENNPATGETLSPDDLVQVKQRIEALEGVDHERDHALTLRYLGGAREEIDALKARVWALEQATPETPAAIDEARLVEVLDQQEWFWEKLMRKAGEAAESAVEEAINDHCSTYDHDDYDNVSSTVNDVDLDNVVTHDNLRDEIQRVLREVTISIDV